MLQRFVSHSLFSSHTPEELLAQVLRLWNEKKIDEARDYFERSNLFTCLKISQEVSGVDESNSGSEFRDSTQRRFESNHPVVIALLIHFISYHLSKYNFEKLGGNADKFSSEDLKKPSSNHLDMAYHYLSKFGFNLQSPVTCLVHGIYAAALSHNVIADKLLDTAVQSINPVIKLRALLHKASIDDKNGLLALAAIHYEHIQELLQNEKSLSESYPFIQSFVEMNIARLASKEYSPSTLSKQATSVEDICISIIIDDYQKTDPQQRLLKIMDLLNNYDVNTIPMYLQECLLNVLVHFDCSDFPEKLSLMDADKIKDFFRNVFSRFSPSNLKQQLLWLTIFPSNLFLSKIFYIKRTGVEPSIKAGRLHQLCKMLGDEIYNNHGLIYPFDGQSLFDPIVKNSHFMQLLRENHSYIYSALNNQFLTINDYIKIKTQEIRDARNAYSRSFEADVVQGYAHDVEAHLKFKENPDYFLRLMRLHPDHYLHYEVIKLLREYTIKNPLHAKCHQQYPRYLRKMNNARLERQSLTLDFYMGARTLHKEVNHVFDEVIQAAKLATMISPSSSNAFSELAVAYYDKASSASIKDNERMQWIRRAIQSYVIALRIAPLNEKAGIQKELETIYLDLAKQAYQQGKAYYRNNTSVYGFSQTPLGLIAGMEDLRIESPADPDKKGLAFFEEAKNWCNMVRSPSCLHYANYIRICCDSYTKKTTIDEQILLIRDAIVAKPNFLSLKYTLGALLVKKGDVTGAKQALANTPFNENIYLMVQDEFLPQPHLQATLLSVLNADCQEECKEFLLNDPYLYMHDAHVDGFFEALAKTTYDEIFESSEIGRVTQKDRLFTRMKHIKDPVLKIEILVQALSSKKSKTMIGAFFHTKFGLTTPAFNSLTGASILNKVMQELVSELEKFKDRIQTSSVDQPVINNPRLKKLILEDKDFRDEVAKFSPDLRRLLVKSVGLTMEDLAKNDSALDNHSLWSSLAPSSLLSRFGRPKEEDTYQEDLSL